MSQHDDFGCTSDCRRNGCPDEAQEEMGYTDIIQFGQYLHSIDSISTVGELFEYLEKPWKWETEFQAWRQAGRDAMEERKHAMSTL